MKVGMVSLGCPKNQVDAEVMVGLLRKAGHEMVADETEAEVIVVNTCGFIREAKEESIEAVLEMAELKDSGRLKYLIATGCLTQRYRPSLAHEMPEVDAYLGAGEFPLIADTLAALIKGQSPDSQTPPPVSRYIYSHETPRIRFTPRHWAFLKVSEGCDNRCSYCVIPAIRGGLRSRAMDSVVEEARMMASEGVKELCVIGQDITAFGSDRKGGATLEKLLHRLEKVKGIEWIRLLYTHPAHFTDGLIDLIAESPKVLRYLDIPVQHIDDEILKRMGRKATSDDIRALIAKLRSKMPDVALRTSLIVGFPGETKARFAELLGFVKEAQFDHLGVFGYSEEEDTPAAMMDGKVSEELAEERRERIMGAQKKISLKKNKARVGDTYRVLVDGPSSESELLVAGRAYFQAPEIDGVVYIAEGDVTPGAFADVKITKAGDYDLVGKAVPAA